MHQKRVLAAAAEIAGGKDPLHGDREDEVKYMLRRTENIMTKNFGAVAARCTRVAHTPQRAPSAAAPRELPFPSTWCPLGVHGRPGRA